jgi:hypothetical protein
LHLDRSEASIVGSHCLILRPIWVLRCSHPRKALSVSYPERPRERAIGRGQLDFLHSTCLHGKLASSASTPAQAEAQSTVIWEPVRIRAAPLAATYPLVHRAADLMITASENGSQAGIVDSNRSAALRINPCAKCAIHMDGLHPAWLSCGFPLPLIKCNYLAYTEQRPIGLGSFPIILQIVPPHVP